MRPYGKNNIQYDPVTLAFGVVELAAASAGAVAAGVSIASAAGAFDDDPKERGVPGRGDAQAAADRERRRRLGAKGRQSTILTGSRGLLKPTEFQLPEFGSGGGGGSLLS